MWINAAGEKFWVKYHFHTQQGMAFFSNEEASAMAGSDADCHRRDRFAAIEQGEYPRWILSVQVMPYADAKTYRINPRSEEHTSELQSLMRISYAVFCLTKKKNKQTK